NNAQEDLQYVPRPAQTSRQSRLPQALKGIGSSLPDQSCACGLRLGAWCTGKRGDVTCLPSRQSSPISTLHARSCPRRANSFGRCSSTRSEKVLSLRRLRSTVDWQSYPSISTSSLSIC